MRAAAAATKRPPSGIVVRPGRSAIRRYSTVRGSERMNAIALVSGPARIPGRGVLAARCPLPPSDLLQESAPSEWATMYLSMRRMFKRSTWLAFIQSEALPPHVRMSSQLTTTNR